MVGYRIKKSVLFYLYERHFTVVSQDLMNSDEICKQNRLLLSRYQSNSFQIK